MLTRAFAHNKKPALLTTVFLFALLGTTALPILMNPPSALAGSDTYPTSIAGCRAVSGNPPGSFTCDLKDSTQDMYYDPWGEENRECTSYAAWMLHSVNGFEMPFFDYAYNWGPRAQGLGYTVDMNPEPGSIYWKAGTGSSHTGQHVAYVESVSADGSTVTTEDYNSDFTGHWAEEPNVSTSSASGYIHFKDIANPSLRIATVNTTGDVIVKTGSVYAGWSTAWDHTVMGTAIDVQMSPNRIAVLDSSGNLWASAWPMTGGWTELWAGGLTPSTYQVADSFVAVLSGGMVYTKVGTSLGGTWNPTINPTVSFKMAQNGNLAAVLTNGNLYVAWGGYGNPFTLVASGFSSYAISNNVIGAVFGGTLDVMIGAPVNNHWNVAFNPAASVQLSQVNGNIGVVDTSGYLDVAWGGYGSPWTAQVANGFTESYVSDTQVGVLFNGGSLDIKEGGPGGSWVTVNTNSVAFAIT